jgi:hypothetical protein
MLKLLFAISGMAMAIDPGCGAGIGSNTANGSDGAAVDMGVDAGGLPQMNCGSLGSHYFCDTFSEATLPGVWDDETVSAGALSLDGTRFDSPSQSLLATTTSLTTGTRTYARVEKHLTASVSHFVFGFSEWVDPSCVANGVTVQSGNLALGSNQYFLAIGHAAGGDSILETSLVGGAYLQAHDLPAPLPRGTWTRLVLDVDLVAAKMNLSVNGNIVVQGEPLKYPPGSPQIPTVAPGTLTDGTFNEPACQMWIDDVTFDAQL